MVKYAKINAIAPMIAEATAALSPTESPAPLLPEELAEPEETTVVVASGESSDAVAEVEALEVVDESSTTGVTELALLPEVGDGVDEEGTSGLRKQTNKLASEFLTLIKPENYSFNKENSWTKMPLNGVDNTVKIMSQPINMRRRDTPLLGLVTYTVVVAMGP
jgi:hypothetical protein